MVKLTINVKLILSFLLIAMIFVSIGAYTDNIRRKASNDIIEAVRIIDNSCELENHIWKFFSVSKDYLLITQRSELEVYKSKWSVSLYKINAHLDFLIDENVDLYSLSVVESNIETSKTIANDLINTHNLLAVSTDDNKIDQLKNEERVNLIAFENVLEKTQEALDRIKANSKEKLNQAILNEERTAKASQISFAIAFFFSIFLPILISRPMAKNIIKLRDASNQITQGNLDVKIDVNSRDEIGELAKSFASMGKNLKKSNIQIKEYINKVQKSEKQLQSKVEELEKFNKMVVGRELKMIELKKRVRELEDKLKEK
jgi:HAMP domain-containing protein